MNLRMLISNWLPELPTSRKARIALNQEPPNLSSSATVVSIQGALRAAEGGDTRELFALYRDMTVGGTHVQAEFNKRKLAILAQPLNVLPVRQAHNGPGDKPGVDDLKAAAAMQQVINDCENWNDGVSHLLDSCLWPVAVVEKVFRPVEPGEPAAKLGLKYTLRRLEVVNPTLLCFRPRYGTGNYGRNGRNGMMASEEAWEAELRFWSTDEEGRILYDYDRTYGAERSRHVVHRGHLLTGVRDCWGGPMRALLFWWLLTQLARDWFGRGMERWGSPFVVGRTDAKNPAAVKMLQEAFSLSTKIGGLVVDNDTQVELKEIAASGMADAYERFIAVCNREVSTVVVGQTLSAEAQSTGLGSGVGKLHSEVREDIRMFDQVRLGDTLRAQVFRQVMEVNGIAGGLPKPVWGGLSDEDAKSFAELLNTLGQAGLEPTDEAISTLNERLGFPVQRRVQSPSTGPGQGMEQGAGRCEPHRPREQEEETEELSALISPRVRGRLAALSAQANMADALGVPAGWLNPLTRFLEELTAKAADQAVSEADLLRFLDAAVLRVPELFKDMDVDELARVMEAGMGEAVVDSVRQKLKR